jgi:hypothetical protein
MTPVDVERLKNAIGDMVVYDTVASRTAYLPSVLARVDILAVRAEKAEAECERLRGLIAESKRKAEAGEWTAFDACLTDLARAEEEKP